MRTPTVPFLSASALSAGLLVTVLAGPAAAVCDAYSGNCMPTPSTSSSVIPTTNDRDEPADESGSGTGTGTGDTASDAATLPFTGGELVLMTALGAGALAGGAALVVAGRRRKPDVA